MPAIFTVAVQIFILLELLLELGFGNVDGSVHVKRFFFDDNCLVRQAQRDLDASFVLILGLILLEMHFGMRRFAAVP